MSRNGYMRIWTGSRLAMQAWRHSGGPVIQLLLNSRRTFTSAGHSAHLATYCASRVVAMTPSTIVRLHTSVLTSVASAMNILAKRRNVDLGMSCYVLALTALTPSQCRAFGGTRVCQGFSSCHYCTYTPTFRRCAVNLHLCGEVCKLSGKKGCLGGCIKVRTRTHTNHKLLLTLC